MRNKMQIGDQKNLVVNNKILTYKGIFHADELFSTINRALEARGYEKREKKTEDVVTEDGRRTFIELRPSKSKTSYAKLMIKLRITLNNVTDTVEEFEGQKRKFDLGDIEIAFDSWVLTDYEERWGGKAWVFFLKGMINKFVYKWPLEGSFPGELVSDTAYIYAQIKKLLNSYKGEVGKKMYSDTEIAKDVQKDVAAEIKGMKKWK